MLPGPHRRTPGPYREMPGPHRVMPALNRSPRRAPPGPRDRLVRHAVIRVAVMIGLASIASLSACGTRPADDASAAMGNDPYVVVLGIGQDGGYPQAGMKPGPAWAPDRRRFATAIAVVDPASGERWLFEATPDFKDQLHLLDRIAPVDATPGLTGILLSHAHVGHYTGLIHLGHEVIGAHGVPVYAMARMHAFLSTNGPWDQLVRYGNIELRPLADGTAVPLNARISITPFRVPHRDEYSETVGFRIQGPNRSVVFLPDIDKWERWDEWGVRIEDVVAGADVAYLDGTFYADGEVPGRAMADIPHPFVTETMRRFEGLPAGERAKIRFIHLNRTNPAAEAGGAERRAVVRGGFRVAERMERVGI